MKILYKICNILHNRIVDLFGGFMKTAIIYSSETGFTKKYALWLEEKLGSDAKAYSLKEAKKVNFDDCDALVYGGWVCAAQINGAKWFKEKMPSWAASGKKLALWATGGSPMESPDIPKALDVMLTEDEKKIAKVFYCPGGFNYENMKPMYRLMMKMFVKMLSNKKDLREIDKEAVKMMSHSYDIADQKYLEPIVEYLKG